MNQKLLILPSRAKGVNASKRYEDGVMGILSDIKICRGLLKDSFSEEMGVLYYLSPENLYPFYLFYENLTLR